MECYILETLERNYPGVKTISKVDDVIQSYKSLMKCKTLDDLRQYISDAFIYKYILNDSNLVKLKLNSKHSHDWKVSKDQHKYLSIINRESKILTWDSMNASKLNKAGISGLIEKRYLSQLENFIRVKHPNVFTMTSIKLAGDLKDYKQLKKLVEKYNYKGPFYSIDVSYENDEWKTEPGYRSFYTDIGTMIRHIDELINSLFPIDKELDKYLKINSTNTKKEFKEDLRSRELYIISFLGNNINDNNLFKILSEFRPYD